jgi:outer membrane lipoprotein-sorting protein
MNCSECREHAVAYAEGVLDEAAAAEMASHLRGCPPCRAELDQVRQLQAELGASGRACSRRAADSSVMDRIVREQANKLRRLQMRRRLRFAGTSAAAAAVILAALAVGVFRTGANGRAEAAEVLAKGANAVAGLRTVHIKCRMRTLPRDNFDLIWLKHDFVKVELWKRFADPPQWRLEKPGRVAIMDGRSALMLIKEKPNIVYRLIKEKPNTVYRSGPNAGYSQWLMGLLDVDKILIRELQSALAGEADLKLTNERDDAGRRKLVVTVEAKAQGDPTNDWLKNKFVQTSDNRRTYRFDAKTKRLEGLKVHVHTDKGNVLVLDIVAIDYDEAIDDSLFKLDVPEDAVWPEESRILPDNDKYEKMTPAEAARAFFEACAKEDMKEARKFAPAIGDRCYLRGLKLIKIGEPFQSKPYPHWFVPYEIKLKSGKVIKHNLAFRKHEVAKRYIVDGGY